MGKKVVHVEIGLGATLSLYGDLVALSHEVLEADDVVGSHGDARELPPRRRT